ncbi:carboxymuconolactone decarboxylase family protein [Methylobacterium brachythecii]|uniref:Carboxymuconolactone decarboxylase n=1 Tax=Methylobacterium brachythecii TaxID=1176177 RepID=A0A7W6F6B2_9HYPH|nr:carboxymuconolactone decarboxylase family protein [Methylobacterium brachythecii]MBB3902148.1 4-carboxymuconolactone decarboxylase [Methylobacterium brachythecii]GLS44545.1 carboxymuconolactone decarboxylase [Methylobacterium brachythecii]
MTEKDFRVRFAVTLAIGLLMTATASAQDRMPEIPAAQQTEAQKKASEEFLAARKVPVFGPFVPLLRSPQLMLNASNMGLYLRYNSVIPLKLSEFTILLTAREWDQQLEWQIHEPIALKAGLDPAVVEAVREGRRPDTMGEEETLVYAFSTELHRNKSVSDTTYARVIKTFGEQGAIDLAGINGYYTLLAMTLNMARTALPPGVAPPLPALVK